MDGAQPRILQLLASVFSYLARDGAAGAAVGVLLVSWLAIGLVDIATGSSQTSESLGLMLIASAVALGCCATAVSIAKPLAGAVFGFAAARFALAGVYQLSATTIWQHIGGIVGLIVVAVAFYCALAFELESQKHPPMLPTFRQGAGDIPISDGASRQLQGVANEAGVRQTT